MNDISKNSQESDDCADEKELMDIFNSMDDDLINRQIDELLTEKGEHINMDNIREKAFKRLEKVKRRRSIIKKAGAVAAVALLSVSTVYAKDIQKVLRSFFGKSTVYQTVVDGEAYYLPEKLALGDKYVLRYANMSENRLELSIETTEQVTGDWYENLELSISELEGGKSYVGGGYSFFDGALEIFFYDMPTLSKFDINIDGEAYPISLTKADSLAVDEGLVIGVSEREENTMESIEEGSLPLIASVAASRNDNDSGVGINIIVGFDDRDLKLSTIGELEESIFKRMFQNDSNGVIGSSNGAMTKPIMAYDSDGNAYELREPANAVGRPITVFETSTVPGKELILKIPAVQAHYEKEVGRIMLSIPKDGEVEVGEEIDFIIQKAIVSTIKRTSETTAEIMFELNTGIDKSVKISDISAYSKDVSNGQTVVTGNTAIMTLAFDKNLEEAELEFTWPCFIIEGNWSIVLE